MIAISLQFIAGRYHATPWGRHVNEGAVEWPPSPWRILRALIAVWKRTLPDVRQEEVEGIFRSLSATPEFVLPRASTGHARHFMPWFKKGPDDRTLVFDAFVALPRDSTVVVRWPDVELGGTEREILARILANLDVLGRSESWCEARLLDEAASDRAIGGSGLVSRPLAGDEAPAGYELVRLLCADPDSAFEGDRVLAGAGRARGRRAGRAAEAGRPIYDPAWNICVETLHLHRERWSDPPGSRWVPYLRPRGCLGVEPSLRRPVRPDRRPSVQVVRYVLDSAVLPLVTETLTVAETARRHLLGIYGRLHCAPDGKRGRSPTLSGKDAEGRPLEGHRHAYYLPTDEDGDGRLDHLTIVATGGFGPKELAAIDRLEELKSRDRDASQDPLRVLLLGRGAMGEYAPGPLAHSAVWASATPYIATRYAKTRGPKAIELGDPEARSAFLAEDLRRQIVTVRRDLAGRFEPNAIRIEPLFDKTAFRIAGRWRPLQFKRYRAKRNDDGGRRPAGAFRIEFPAPIAGPLCLGHSSHFGMGLFLPAETA